MTDTNLLTVATYVTAPTTHLAKAILGEHGIRSAVLGDQVSGYQGLVITKVELLVSDADADDARQLLWEWEQAGRLKTHDRWGIKSRMGWLCSHCAETNQQSFDKCWSCSASRSAHAALAPLPDDVEANAGRSHADTTAENPDTSPFRVPMTTTLPSVDKELAGRILRSAVFGIGFPPLTTYSFVLSWRCFSSGSPPPKVWAAFCLNVASVFVWLLVFNF